MYSTTCKTAASHFAHPYKLNDGNDEGTQGDTAQVVDDGVAQGLKHREHGLPGGGPSTQAFMGPGAPVCHSWPTANDTLCKAAWNLAEALAAAATACDVSGLVACTAPTSLCHPSTSRSLRQHQPPPHWTARQ